MPARLFIRVVVCKKMKPIQIKSIDPYHWDEILSASQAEGHNMINRLLNDFRAGTNRFDVPGEILCAHLSGNTVVAVAGLNHEKDTTFGKAARVRRLYVVPRCRGKGLARSLIEELILFASPRFDTLTVNVGKLEAQGFYEHLGFKPVEHSGFTHIKELAHNKRVERTA